MTYFICRGRGDGAEGPRVPPERRRFEERPVSLQVTLVKEEA